MVEDPCQVDIVSYQTDIFPIVESACSIPSCHSSQNTALSDYSQYNELMVAALEGRLWFRVGVTRSMPPLNRLDTTQINLFKKWIDCGALNN